MKQTIIATLPIEENVASGDPKKLAEFLELDTSERLGECVCYHVISWTIE